MAQNKILNHKDKDEIISWLTSGVSVREVEKRLNHRYRGKNQAGYRVSSSTIQEFKANFLNIKGKVLADIKEASSLSRAWARQQEAKTKVEESSAYQEAITKIAKQELDVAGEIMKVFHIVESRIESLYNRLEDREFPDKDVEKLLQSYLDQFMRVLDQHKKYVEGYREQVDVNINVSVMNEQVGALRDALREVLSEVDPAVVPLFMGKLNKKMKELVYRDSDTSAGHSQLLDGVLTGEEIE